MVRVRRHKTLMRGSGRAEGKLAPDEKSEAKQKDETIAGKCNIIKLKTSQTIALSVLILLFVSFDFV